MKCPFCASEDHTRYRTPKIRGIVLYRRHRCHDCKATFMTAEIVVEGKVAIQLALLEDLI